VGALSRDLVGIGVCMMHPQGIEYRSIPAEKTIVESIPAVDPPGNGSQ